MRIQRQERQRLFEKTFNLSMAPHSFLFISSSFSLSFNALYLSLSAAVVPPLTLPAVTVMVSPFHSRLLPSLLFFVSPSLSSSVKYHSFHFSNLFQQFDNIMWCNVSVFAL